MPQNELSLSTFYILLALATGPRHGYDIMKQAKVDSRGQCKLGPGTLYGSVKRLLADGLIIEVAGEQISTERSRRYYQLTSKGQAGLAAKLQESKQLVDNALAKNISLTF